MVRGDAVLRKLFALLLCALPLQVFAQSTTLTISNTNEDGEQDPFGMWNATAGTLYASADPFENFIGLSFTLDQNIDSNCTFSGAYIRLWAIDTDGAVTLNIGVEDADPTTNTIWSDTHLPSGASIVGGGSAVSSTTYANNTWYFGSGDTNATNLASALNTLMGSTGPWVSGERLNVRVVGTAGSGYLGVQDSGNGTNDPTFSLAWTCSGGEPAPPEVDSVTPSMFEDEDPGIVIAGANFSAEGNTVLICPTDDVEDMDCEEQTITAEGAEEITFTAVQGANVSDMTSFLFVINADMAANEDGFEVTFLEPEEPIVATKLVFGSQPGNIVVGQTFGAFTVRAVDDGDNLDVTFESNVTVALQTGNGELAGTLTEPAVAGIATFDDVHIDTLNTNAVIRATASGLTAADSDPFDVTAGGEGGAAGFPSSSRLGGVIQR